MKDKLQKILDSEGLKSGQLAEILGVNPGGISHILSGRNKPSYDLLQKILRRFPQINPDWLLLDATEMYRQNADKEACNPSYLKLDARESVPKSTEPSTEEHHVFSAGAGSTQPLNQGVYSSDSHRRAVRVVVMYDDHTFDSFIPNADQKF